MRCRAPDFLNPERRSVDSPTLCRLYSTQSPWDPSQLATSRIIRAPFNFENAKVPSPDASGSCATCSPDDRQLRLNRGIATRDFDVHVVLALINPDMSMRDGKWVLLALEDLCLPEVQVVDSLLLRILLFPRLDSVQDLLGSNPMPLCKELSLLS
jgi:hypothetical protein